MYNTALYNALPIGGLIQPSQAVHVVLLARYQVATAGINRSYLTGADSTGNPVTGYHEDDTEIGLVGERLRFNFDNAITTAALAKQVATAVLDKARLQQRKASIIIPPHCGIEQWDVVSVLDPLAAQTPQLYRVIGIRLLFDTDNGGYLQQLTLGAV
jgi:hypothetical protein